MKEEAGSRDMVKHIEKSNQLITHLRREDDVDGRATVTRDDGRVLLWGG